MIKKQRIYNLDFIRAVAVVMILLTHYNANFIGFNGPVQLNKVILTAFPFHIYIGDLGVGLFLLISGASMYHVYVNKQLNLVSFAKKRLFHILPMFYISYVLAFFYNFWMNKGFSHEGVSLKWGISTIFGFDSLMQTSGFPSFMLVGEWFLGLIMIVYLLFPLIKIFFEKQMLLTLCIAIFLFVIIQSIQDVNNHYWLLIQYTVGLIPVFIFGMALQKYVKVCANLLSVCLSIMILAVTSLVKFDFIAPKIMMAIVSIAVFIILLNVSKYFEQKLIKRVVTWLVKYSYPIFLIHHFLINKVVLHFDLLTISRLDSYILFAFCLCLIFPISVLIYHLEKAIVNVR